MRRRSFHSLIRIFGKTLLFEDSVLDTLPQDLGRLVDGDRHVVGHIQQSDVLVVAPPFKPNLGRRVTRWVESSVDLPGSDI